MRLNVITGVIFIIIALIIAILSWRGVFKDTWLDKADKIASIIAFGIAVTSFFLPLGNSSNSTGLNQKIHVGDDAANNIIGQSGTGNVNIGDVTTSAKQRADVALSLITNEILENINFLSVIIQTVSNRPPKAFWDKRRLNETELAYQDRARSEYRGYHQEIEQYLHEVQRKYAKNTYASQQNNLSYYSNHAKQVKDIYNQLDETIDMLSRLSIGLQNLASLNHLTDIERTNQSYSLFKEKIADMKMNFTYAAGQYCLIINQDEYVKVLNNALQLAGIEGKLSLGEDGYRIAMQLTSKYAQEKAQILKARTLASNTGGGRKIEKYLNDPYLIMLRKTIGLPDTLSEGEIYSLQNKQLNLDEQDPAQLYNFAALSYLESDGQAAVSYFRKALEVGTLSPTQRHFANLSLDRLENPNKYKGSIGVMITKLTENGNFQRAGLNVGDVIIAVNEDIINEAFDIASVLGKSQQENVLVTILREGQEMIISLKAHESAGAQVTQLIILNIIQI